MKTCIIEGCNSECEKGRRYCREHYLERKRKQSKEHYLKFGRYNYNCICLICGKHFQGGTKHSILCSKECKDAYQRIDSTNATDNYLFKKKTSLNEHRCIVEEILHRKLKYNEVVHHIDGNPKNNAFENLIVLSRSNHIKLHRALAKEKAISINKLLIFSESGWIKYKKEFTMRWLNENKIDCILINKTGKIEEKCDFSQFSSCIFH